MRRVVIKPDLGKPFSLAAAAGSVGTLLAFRRSPRSEACLGGFSKFILIFLPAV
jgi:hypothetical protein